MAQNSWEIQGTEIGNCNCDWGCPCQFNALPTHGNCQAIAAIQIDKGHHSNVSLDGLRFGFVARWPGAVHQGDGEFIPFIDERANDDQRKALHRIVSGQDSEPGATFFAVFATTYTKVHEPVFAAIEYDCDLETRIAQCSVPNLVDTNVTPITNATTGETQEVSVILPGGFEFREAQFASGTTRTQGAIEIGFDKTHTHLANLHIGPNGPLN